MQVINMIKRIIFTGSILLCLLFTLSCQSKKHIDIYFKDNQRGWCFLFYTSDSTKFKKVNNNYEIYLDSNNVAFVPSQIMEGYSKEYELRALNEKGEVINDLFKMVFLTEINHKKVKHFYYPTEKEQQLPRITFSDPNDYKDSLLSVCSKKVELLEQLNY